MLSGMMWAVVLALRLPLLAQKLLHPHPHLNTSLCCTFNSYDKPPLITQLHYVVYILEFFLLFLLLIFCSLRIICILRQRQLDKKQQKFRPNDCRSYRIAAELFSMSIGFTYLNSTLDPVIYCFSSTTFQNTLKTSFNALGICQLQVSQQENDQ
ncbi:hypothetical protein SKAU_G00161860 [Synaphobranchus kaupii]|uniref:Vomeronasal type-1 receptor n=1 Tax=Synaphobranchus kaupii TaxID=118154 RepID=A0A9Q1FIU3_SYNKA|nr:hypothetical protein SKAU_G00161860 [Synaphobranchus kaupii]